MTTPLPPPMVPVEVDLRDFGFMPLDVRTLLSSSLWIKAKRDPRVAHAAVSLWCECWHQVPAASLPDDDEVLADLARCDDKEWKRIRDRALLHFVKCSDGRLYHRHVAEKALEAWGTRTEYRETKTNKETRQQRWRQRLREASQALRDRGVTPPAGASLETLERLLEETKPSPETSTSASTSASTVDAREIGKTGTGTVKEGEPALRSPPAPADAPAPAHEPASAPAYTQDENPPEALGHSPTPAGAVCKAMRKAGLQQTNPGDPRLKALLEQGATVDEFVGLVGEALAKGINAPWPWILKTLEARRAEAAAIELAPPAAKPAQPSGAQPLYRPEPGMTPEERAAADAKRVEVMAQHRRSRRPA